jgi:hypothetical protein
MSTRSFRPGFHKSQFFGTVPAGRVLRRDVAGTATPRHDLNTYEVVTSSGYDHVYAASLAEARALSGARGLVLYQGQFQVGGVTVRVREGVALP